MTDAPLTNQELKSVIEKGTVLYTVANGLTKVIAVSNTVLVLASLTPYAYGVAELALSVVGVFSIFQLAGLERTVVSDMGLEKGRGNLPVARRIFQDFFILLSLFALLAWSILFFGSEIVGRYFTDEIGSYFVILSFLFLVSPLGALMRMLYALNLDFLATSLFTFLQEATKMIFLATIFFVDDLSISYVLWSYVVASGVPFFLLLHRTYPHVQRILSYPAHGSFAPHRFILGHNFWTLVSNYLDNATKSIRLWFIKLFLGTEAVALFSVASGIVGQLSSFLNLSSTIAPVLPQYVGTPSVFYRIIDKAIKYQVLLAFILIAVGAATIPILVEYLFPQYLMALPLFYMLIFILIPSSINNVFQTMFYVLKAQRSLFAAQIIRLASVILIAMTAIPAFGIAGVALEYIGTTILFGLERYRILRRMYPGFKIDIRDFFTFDEYDRLLIQRVSSRCMRLLRM